MKKSLLSTQVLVGIAVILGLSVLMMMLPINQERQTINESQRLLEAYGKKISPDMPPVNVTQVEAPPAWRRLADRLTENPLPGAKKKKPVNGTLRLEKQAIQLVITVETEHQKPVVSSVTLAGWWSMLPPILAVVLAITTRKLLLSLLLGTALGGALTWMNGSLWRPVAGFAVGTGQTLYSVLTSDFHIYIFIFTFSLIGMVNVINANGGIEGLARLLRRVADSRRNTQLATVLTGLAIFFDDYSNTVVVGAAMRTLSDRARISREKLSYLIDSTTAPIAGLALISTWIGYELSLIGDGLKVVGETTAPFSVFISSLPYRFYCIMTLIFVFLGIFTRREFGPMLHAENRAVTDRLVLRPESRPLAGDRQPKSQGVPNALSAVLPVLSVILLTLAGLMLCGAGVTCQQNGCSLNRLDEFTFARVFSLSDNYMVGCMDSGLMLAVAAIAGSLIAFFMGMVVGKVPLRKLLKAWWSASNTLALAFGVLVLSWSIGHINGQVGASSFIVSSLVGESSAWALPVIMFVIAGAISFSTGSSWGTMAVLLPTVIPLAHHIGGMPLLMITVGTVLDGSIFGDHCSPLSDTTILSSISAGCDHLDHVKTQMPYALVVGGVAMTLGYGLTSVMSPWISYGLAAAGFFLIFNRLGKIPGAGRGGKRTYGFHIRVKSVRRADPDATTATPGEATPNP